MSQSDDKLELTPVAEGLVGALVGAILGGVLWLLGVISPIAILGVAAGVGAGSWFNGWRRSRNSG
ncbi:MAG: hypothetical protein AAFX86_07195 [Pseudomonadota bacterium]